jgi:hypothetical protein
MTYHNRRRGAGNTGHVVMLCDPDPAIAPSLSMNCNVAGVVKGATRVGVLGDANEIKNG